MSVRTQNAVRGGRVRTRQRWDCAIHKCIARNLTRKLEFVKVDPSISQRDRLHVRWRLGLHLFYSHQYYDAIDMLDLVCRNGNSEADLLSKQAANEARAERRIEKMAKAQAGSLIAQLEEPDEQAEEDDDEELLHGNYHVHLLAGRCCVKLFLASKAHYHLESAYKHYQNCVESMTVPNSWEQKTTLRLPIVLHELGHIMEHYGAFASAIDIYSRVMTEFHHYRGYFDVMYRSAVVGRHLADLMAKPEDCEQMLNKCMDMLQFLLEALPSTIDESHIILLYARTLDKSKDPGIRFRSNGIYKSLFDVLKASQRCNAEKFSTHKEWGDVPKNWFDLGEEIVASGEPLLAKDAFELFTLRVESKRNPGKELHSYIDVQTAMKVAKNYAIFQNFPEAVRFADLALQNDRLNKEVRSCLSQWSKIYAVKLAKETAAVNTMHANWKIRVWSQAYREKAKNVLLHDLEARIEKNPFDREARSELSYFARDKWRARFLFETTCAVRLQRFMRGRIQIWKAQQRLRTRYLNRAVEAYRLYLKTPFDYDVRQEIKAVTRSRHCPRKHIINKVIAAILGQDAAIKIVHRAYASFRNRRAIMDGLARTKRSKENKLFSSAVVIQCLVRQKRSRRVAAQRQRQRAKENLAVSIIQNYVRWRNSTFQHAVTRVICKRRQRHRHARLTFIHVFAYYMRRYIKRKRDAIRLAGRDKRKRAQDVRYHTFVDRRQSASTVLQRFFLLLQARKGRAIASLRMRQRGLKQFSALSENLSDEVSRNPDAKYQVPGVSQTSQQFQRSLQQVVVQCSGSFSSADCMMLGTVLRNGQCRVQKLILREIKDSQNACFEFDLLPAISKCRSLRSVSLLGGSYSPSFLKGVVREVQVDNPRIKELVIEGVRSHKSLSENLTSWIGCLLLDYFNYSVSGITTISLHDCLIRDTDLDVIAQGLRVNYSLKHLTLSKNLITDAGSVLLLQAYMQNRKTSLATLDLRQNLVECRWRVRSLLNLLNAAATEEDIKLTIHLAANMLATRYEPPADDNPLFPRPIRVVVLQDILEVPVPPPSRGKKLFPPTPSARSPPPRAPKMHRTVSL